MEIITIKSVILKSGRLGIGVLLSLWVVSSGWCSTTSEMYRTKAVLDLYAGKHQEALEKLNRALQDDPRDFTSLYYRGIVYTRIGEFQKAIEDIERATKNGVDFEGLHFELGYAYYLNENLNQAQAALEKAYLDYPNHAPAKYYLGLVYYQQGMYSQCIQPLNEAVELDPTFGPSAAYLIGDAYVNLQRFDLAENILAKSLEDYPDSVYSNATRELLEKIRSKQQETKRFYAHIAGGVASDSNVGLFPDGQPLPGNKSASDTRAYIDLSARYKIYSAQRQWVQLGYQFFGSKHSELSEYDLNRHALSVGLRDKRKWFTWGITYEFAKSDLNNRNFTESGNFVPNLFIAHGKNIFSLATFQVLDTDYLLAGLEQRSSYFYELLYRFYYAASGDQKQTYFLGLRMNQDNPADNEYDYTGYAVEAGYESRLFGGQFYGQVQYGERDYTESAIARKNQHAEASLKYTYPLTKSLQAEGSALYINNPSNDPDYDYDRYVFSALLRWTL